MASGTVGTITWNLDESTGLMTVSGSGAIPDYSSGGTPWNAYLDDIQDVVIEDGITVIGTYAFDSCEYLISVSMGDTVTTIKDYAFRYCYALEKIKLSASLTTIEDFTFYKDENLTGVVFPASVTSIGTFAFNGCDNLTDIRFEGDQPTLGSSSFNVGGSSAVIQTNGWGSDEVFTTTVRGSSTTFTYKALQPLKGVHIKMNGEWVNVNSDLYALVQDKQDKLTIDDALDGASSNPIQNKVVNQAIYNLGVQLRSEMAGLGGKSLVSSLSTVMTFNSTSITVLKDFEIQYIWVKGGNSGTNINVHSTGWIPISAGTYVGKGLLVLGVTKLLVFNTSWNLTSGNWNEYACMIRSDGKVFMNTSTATLTTKEDFSTESSTNKCYYRIRA